MAKLAVDHRELARGERLNARGANQDIGRAHGAADERRAQGGQIAGAQPARPAIGPRRDQLAEAGNHPSAARLGGGSG